MIRPLYVAHATVESPTDTARALPFMLGGPARYEDRFELELPAGYHAASLAATAWSGSIGEYGLTQESSDEQIVLTRRLVLHAEVVPAAEFQQVQQLLRHA